MGEGGDTGLAMLGTGGLSFQKRIYFIFHLNVKWTCDGLEEATEAEGICPWS